MSEPEPKVLTPNEIDPTLVKFIREAPLLQKLRVQTQVNGRLGSPPTIPMACAEAKCQELETTTWERSASSATVVGELWVYQCLHCGKRGTRQYWILQQIDQISEGQWAQTIQKIGQHPSWSLAVPRELERSISKEDLALYKKGLVSLSQGYGVGALAYLRRVVENQVNTLLDMIEEAARLEQNATALKGIGDARDHRDAAERLRLAASLLPASLRPGNANPFSVIYGLLSAGIHELSEDECLEIASTLKGSLEYVFTKMKRNLDDAKIYGESIARAQQLADKVRARAGKQI